MKYWFVAFLLLAACTNPEGAAIEYVLSTDNVTSEVVVLETLQEGENTTVLLSYNASFPTYDDRVSINNVKKVLSVKDGEVATVSTSTIISGNVDILLSVTDAQCLEWGGVVNESCSDESGMPLSDGGLFCCFSR